MPDSDTLTEIIERIRLRFKPEKIIILCGYGAGEATESSDLDLLIVAKTELPAKERFPSVSRLLADYHVAFDVIMKTPQEYQRSRSVVNHIVYLADKYGKVVYERSSP